MQQQRVFGLALEALESRRAALEEDIKRIKRYSSTNKEVAQIVKERSAAKPRARSEASRRAQSRKMKAIWRKRKAAGKKRL